MAVASLSCCRIRTLEFTLELLLAPRVLCVLKWGLSQGADASEIGGNASRQSPGLDQHPM